MIVQFACSACRYVGQIDLPAAGAGDGPGTAYSWQCPACEHRQEIQSSAAIVAPPVCLVCGNQEMYRKKDFPHWLGMSILALACFGFLITMALYHQWLAWAILIGSAVFDGLLYLWVGDAVVCYRCQTHYRKTVPGPSHQPFELTLAERYRQERIRQEQMKSNQ